MIVALIPARGGSKGVPRKNIRLINGKPLVAYAIEAAQKSKFINKVIVSTDDEKIAEVALAYKAEVPFLRPKELAQDDTPDRPVVCHCIEALKARGIDCDKIIFLRPTSPLKTGGLIDAAISIFEKNSNWTSLRTITRVEGVFHPYWMFCQKNETIVPFLPGININDYYRRQLLPPCYRLNGVIDVLRSTVVLNSKNMYGDCQGFLEIEENVSVDIDTELDFKFVEFLMKNHS